VNSTISLFSEKKGKQKISMLTCYDYATACLLNKTNVDSILVGDSLGMVFQGNNDTLAVTMDQMIYHTKVVKKGAPDKFIIGDMPFLSYQITVEDAIRNAGRFLKEGGAEAIKLEGGEEIIDKIKGIIAAKIPVMGHLGLTPQSVNIFGGYKVQGKTLEGAEKILKDALLLEEAGVFAIVLECIPEKLAEIITKKLTIPTIGIGSGRLTDGQVLVINDMLGFSDKADLKFVKRYSEIGKEIIKSADLYIEEINNGKFPEEKHTYKIDDEVIKQISGDGK